MQHGKAHVPIDAGAEHRGIGHLAQIPHRDAVAALERSLQPGHSLIAQRQEEEALQAEAEARLEVEQAARAEEDARLRELYPLPEDEEDFTEEAVADPDEGGTR